MLLHPLHGAGVSSLLHGIYLRLPATHMCMSCQVNEAKAVAKGAAVMAQRCFSQAPADVSSLPVLNAMPAEGCVLYCGTAFCDKLWGWLPVKTGLNWLHL